MLDVTFYSQAKETIDTVDVSDDFYEWLQKSGFANIAKSQEIEMKPDGETVKVSAIVLEGGNRRKFSDFLRDAIVQESDDVLNTLGNSPSKEEYINTTYKLKTLQSLRKFVEDEKCKYLEWE
ncbi:hypothetical protein H6G80_13390 [Nostoc sp. FACHB-87]|uniref:hypothetical protein n=1 Tax=Nostocales TaxID=1161 RepID=UPI0016836097|nr:MULTISPECIES: hypothetical protein [Nostocales]MBD2300825.1 hypothetical protein [Nostoc sp. FACHB-190]MBD2455076.1 hypothetical protein [Nostoc sp. FACHB-87]MBD2477917.1 hypothetical protein [Anabaena sp. FACHB-83]MBD2487330.1 hypothetical protein [Aulosira sp. FACHB-615]MBD2497435.1 hypothetical protein [Nostoc sp. FACHB-280]